MATCSTKSCLVQEAGDELCAAQVKMLVQWLDLTSDEEKGFADSLLATLKANGMASGVIWRNLIRMPPHS